MPVWVGIFDTYEKILHYMNVAREWSATCVLEGAMQGEGVKGNRFVEPAIFAGVTNDMRIAQEKRVLETRFFRLSFDDEEDALHIGNDVVFGLATGVWTSDISQALRMSEKEIEEHSTV